MNLRLIRAGYPIAVIPVSRRAEYIDALVSAQSGGGIAELLSLVADAVRETFVEVNGNHIPSTRISGASLRCKQAE